MFCQNGHPIVFKHPDTTQQYVPLRLNGMIACIVCMAHVVGIQCARTHMAVEICKVSA